MFHYHIFYKAKHDTVEIDNQFGCRTRHLQIAKFLPYDIICSSMQFLGISANDFILNPSILGAFQ